MEDNLAVTVDSSGTASDEGSAATVVDKSAEPEKKSDTTPQSSSPANISPEISALPHANTEGTQTGMPEPKGAQAAANAPQGKSTILLTAAIRQAVVDSLRGANNLAVISEIKALLNQIVNAQTAALPAANPSPAKIDEIKESFPQTVLDGYREEYKELSEIWKGLETKAQGTVTIAGIFIAAAFTFAKDLSDTRLDFYGNLLLGAVIVLLIPSVLFSVMALKTREMDIPPSGDTLKDMVSYLDIKNVADMQLLKVKRGFIYDQAKKWHDVVDERKAAIDEKERWLHTAQGFLLVAICIAATLTLRLLKV